LHYEVVVAASGAQGIAEMQPDGFDLILCDLIMPAIPGNELAEALKHIHPEAAVAFMTGYPLDLLPKNLECQGPVIMKPFGQRDLALMVRNALDGVRTA